MATSLTQFAVTKHSAGYWRVTFSNPPINLVNPETILELQVIVGLIEADKDLRVVVFDSAHPDFFFGRYDLSRAADTPVAPGPTGFPTWIDLTTRLSLASAVSIALIRGRTRGGQPEVPAGVLPGGGAIERLPGLTGRARALEIILGGDDFDAETAERYGWINRALPDAELDGFVDNLAKRIASFDAQALSEAKRLINRKTLPAPQDLLETQGVFLDATTWPSTRARGKKIRERAIALGADFELRMGHHLGAL